MTTPTTTTGTHGPTKTDQFRVVFNEGGTQWFDTYEQAEASRWMNEDGAHIVARSGAKIVKCSPFLRTIGKWPATSKEGA